MATASDTRTPGWYVGCEDYTAGPFLDAREAQDKLEDIGRPRVCWNEHAITFVAPAIRVRFVNQYTVMSGRQFRRYEHPDTRRVVDVLVRLGYADDMRGLLTNPQAKAQAMMDLALRTGLLELTET